MKLTRASFHHVEAELYFYHDTKKEIERIRQDIIHAGKVQQEGGRSGISNPTTSDQLARGDYRGYRRENWLAIKDCTMIALSAS